jgi:hypothetical protein
VRRLIPILCAGALIALVAAPVASALAQARLAAADAATEAVSTSVSTKTESLAVGADYCPQTRRTDDGGRRHTVHKQIKNVFGTVLARYTQVVKWCYTGIPWAPYAGGKITWIDRDRRGTTFSLGWDFVGHIGSWGYGGKGDTVALRGTQGKFRLCGAGTCVQTKTPWIQQQVWGTGQYEWNTGW